MKYLHNYSSLAQSVEHLTVNQGVVGPSPTGGVLARDRAVWSARLAHNQEVVGSNPSPATFPPVRNKPGHKG